MLACMYNNVAFVMTYVMDVISQSRLQRHGGILGLEDLPWGKKTVD